MFESNFYAPLTDARYNSARLTLKPRYQRKLAVSKSSGIVKNLRNKNVKAASVYVANSVVLSEPGLQPIMQPCELSNCDHSQCSSYELNHSSLTGRTLVASEESAQSAKKRVQFANNQLRSLNTTLSCASTDNTYDSTLQLMKKPNLPSFLRGTHHYNVGRQPRLRWRQSHKRRRHSFNYHTYNQKSAIDSFKNEKPKISENSTSENELEDFSVCVSSCDTVTASRQVSEVEPAPGSAESEISTAYILKSPKLKKRKKLAQLFSLPVIALSPALKRVGEFMWNCDSSKHQSFQQQESLLPPEKKGNQQEHCFEKLKDETDRVDTNQDSNFKSDNEAGVISSITAFATPYLQACLDDLPTSVAVNSTSNLDSNDSIENPFQRSQLEQLLEKNAETPSIVNGLVLEHLLFNFGKLQMQDSICSELSSIQPTHVNQQQQQQQQFSNHWEENSFLDGTKNENEIKKNSDQPGTDTQFNYYVPTLFSSECSTKYLSSPGLFSANTAALKIDQNLRCDSASTSPYEDVEFLW